MSPPPPGLAAPQTQRLLAIQLVKAMDELSSSDAFARRLDLLLSRGLDPETRLRGLSGVTGKRCVEETPYVLTPLGIAASWLHWRAIEPLLAVCDPDAADPQGRAPLMVCISRFCHETQQADDFDKTFDLLLARSNPHLADAQGRDALMVAIENGAVEAAKILAPRADLTLADARAERAIDKARLFEQREIEALLAPWDLSQNEAKTLRETSAHSCCSLTPRL